MFVLFGWDFFNHLLKNSSAFLPFSRLFWCDQPISILPTFYRSVIAFIPARRKKDFKISCFFKLTLDKAKKICPLFKARNLDSSSFSLLSSSTSFRLFCFCVFICFSSLSWLKWAGTEVFRGWVRLWACAKLTLALGFLSYPRTEGSPILDSNDKMLSYIVKMSTA